MDTFHPIFLDEILYTIYWDISERIWILRINPWASWKKWQCHTTWKPTENPAVEHPEKKHVDFGGSIGMDVVNFIEPNFM
jgi:hypothetical protein